MFLAVPSGAAFLFVLSTLITVIISLLALSR
jgi:hypothetical protein